MFPAYHNLDITRYFTSWGFYTLGMIQQHRSDIDLVPLQFKAFNQAIEPHASVNYDWLAQRISHSLSQGRTVCLLPEDEHVAFVPNAQLTGIVNQFADQAVYWLTQCDSRVQHLIYQQQHGMRCQMLELPWCVLNDCLTYYRVQQTVPARTTQGPNFLCMINNQDSHKMHMLQAMHDVGLTAHGCVTLTRPCAGFEFCEINQYYPYSDTPPGCSIMGACVRRHNVWISKNVENFLHIEQTYNHIPLIVHPETATLPFMSTEKSVWPVLLGHLFLVWGRPGTMSWIQRFYDVPMDSFAHTGFDTVQPANPTWPWDEVARRTVSLKYLLRQNRELMIDARATRHRLRDQLEAARWSFGKNLYDFFVAQLQQIPQH